MTRIPEWLTVKLPKKGTFEEVAQRLRALGVNTVCENASCPNIGECFCKKTATFMILGNVCTRNCGFCGVSHGKPQPVDADEPERVAKAASVLGLRYVVITSVTRDDLPDGGASHFARTITTLKRCIPDVKVEVLVPDFKGDTLALQRVLDAEPFVLNHNVETVPRLYPIVRPEADYWRSLKLLETARRLQASIHTKSGIMLGLGESRDEVVQVLRDLRRVGCDFVTIGQYLRPSRSNLPVFEYVPPPTFEEYHAIASDLGFEHVASGPFVRSSYHASEAWGPVDNQDV